jgi:hypothetical protein
MCRTLSHKEPLIQPSTITDCLNDSHANDTHQTHFLLSRGRPGGNTQERGVRDTGKVVAAENRSGVGGCVLERGRLKL